MCGCKHECVSRTLDANLPPPASTSTTRHHHGLREVVFCMPLLQLLQLVPHILVCIVVCWPSRLLPCCSTLKLVMNSFKARILVCIMVCWSSRLLTCMNLPACQSLCPAMQLWDSLLHARAQDVASSLRQPQPPSWLNTAAGARSSPRHLHNCSCRLHLAP